MFGLHKIPRRAGSRGKRPDGNGCTSQKSGPLIKRGFFSHVMHNAAFLTIMEPFDRYFRMLADLIQLRVTLCMCEVCRICQVFAP